LKEKSSKLDKRTTGYIFKRTNQAVAMQLKLQKKNKKIGILTTLITNRQLGKGAVLAHG
jgi:hypothetical protein